jgi:hypothetical protein
LTCQHRNLARAVAVVKIRPSRATQRPRAFASLPNDPQRLRGCAGELRKNVNFGQLNQTHALESADIEGARAGVDSMKCMRRREAKGGKQAAFASSGKPNPQT